MGPWARSSICDEFGDPGRDRARRYYLRLPPPLLGRLRVCVSADAATLLTAFGVLGFFRSLLAVEATRFEVFSFRATVNFPLTLGSWR